MKRKHPVKDENPERFDLIDEMESVSDTEMTGLVPSAPLTEEEYKSYNEILPFSPKYFR